MDGACHYKQMRGGNIADTFASLQGYFLLYESMLPSVLYARDRYLREGGLLAPSHTRMLLAAVADCSVITDRLQFWDNVHGFSMQAMKVGLVDEAWTDTLKSDQVVSSVETIFELPHQTMTAKQPSFVAPFSLQVEKSCSVQAFASWFDTWFTPNGLPAPPAGTRDMQGGEKLEGLPPVTTRCPEEKEVRGLDLRKDAVISRDNDFKESKGETVSFTTGPQGLETHWRQTFFVLKEPIEVGKGECSNRLHRHVYHC
jgi:protein arginine N-methyltransferase 3